VLIRVAGWKAEVLEARAAGWVVTAEQVNEVRL